MPRKFKCSSYRNRESEKPDFTNQHVSNRFGILKQTKILLLNRVDAEFPRFEDFPNKPRKRI